MKTMASAEPIYEKRQLVAGHAPSTRLLFKRTGAFILTPVLINTVQKGIYCDANEPRQDHKISKEMLPLLSQALDY